MPDPSRDRVALLRRALRAPKPPQIALDNAPNLAKI